jgi:carbon storage regulator CsrA
MLVLSRKLQQQIKIGDQITVTILKVKGNTVRIGVDAPRDVRVVRGELPKQDQPADSPTATIASAETIVETLPHAEEAQSPTVIAFRVPRPAGSQPASPAEAQTQASAGHLPLRQIRDRFGSAPLKQVVASCATLAK